MATVLKPKEIAEGKTTRYWGLVLRNAIDEIWLQRELADSWETEGPIELDFEDWKVDVQSFYEEAIGVLVVQYGKNAVREHIKFSNMDEWDKKFIDTIIDIIGRPFKEAPL